MIDLTMFETEEDLRKLTGLDRDGLWDNDFDLDDWDVGFCTSIPLTETLYDEDCGEWEEPIKDADWLLHRMEYHCVGYRHTEYNGKHYYMAYHS